MSVAVQNQSDLKKKKLCETFEYMIKMFHFYFYVLSSALTELHLSNKFRKKCNKIRGK